MIVKIILIHMMIIIMMTMTTMATMMIMIMMTMTTMATMMIMSDNASAWAPQPAGWVGSSHSPFCASRPD